jgi:DNA replicative helicase MCM subunit Mcm2 (Cdc46/Mcm family)
MRVVPSQQVCSYIAYARTHCGPRLSASAGQKLISHYVRMRNPGADEAAGGGGNGKRMLRARV